jgi:hypothetical protein
MVSLRRILPATIALSAAAVIAGSAVAATASDSSSQGAGDSTTLRFKQHMTDLVILPGPGQKDPNDPPTPGAQSVINVDLRKSGKPAGQLSLTCIADSRNKFLCHGVYTLPGGQISISELVPGNDPWNGPGAITGGTGKYRDATGQIRTSPINETDSNVVFQISR